jgi:hypothetical protein
MIEGARPSPRRRSSARRDDLRLGNPVASQIRQITLVQAILEDESSVQRNDSPEPTNQTLMQALGGRSSERRKQLGAGSVDARFRDLMPLITALAHIAAQNDTTHHNDQPLGPKDND